MDIVLRSCFDDGLRVSVRSQQESQVVPTAKAVGLTIDPVGLHVRRRLPSAQLRRRLFHRRCAVTVGVAAAIGVESCTDGDYAAGGKKCPSVHELERRSGGTRASTWDSTCALGRPQCRRAHHSRDSHVSVTPTAKPSASP